MRVVYFLPDIEAGVSRIVKNLLLYRPMNDYVQYAVVLFRRDDQLEQSAENDFHRAEVIRFGYKVNENAYDIFKRLSTTLHSASDIIVGNDGLEIKMVAAMKMPNPVVYIIHGDFSYYYSIIRDYHTVIDRIICYSRKIEQEIHRSGVGSNLSLKKIYYPLAKVIYQEQHSLKHNIPTIVFAGSLISRKGADMLPAIYRKVYEQTKNFRLLIIGDGDLMPLLRNEFEGFENVTLFGWVEHCQVLAHLATSHIFLFPSRLEGLPNVILEALQTSTVPVVSKLESGIPDVISDGVNGILIDPDDVDGFANAVIDLIVNPEKYKDMQANAFLVLDKFNPEQQAFSYEESIKEVYGIVNGNRIFPKYRRGRILDRKLLPSWLVVGLRNLIKNPKL